MDETRLARRNLYAHLPDDRSSEHFDTLTSSDAVQVERIVSYGQCSPEGFWYDQDHDEWVLVLRGQAELEVEGLPASVVLGPGDFIDLPAHTRHRVAWTSRDEPTIWLAVHY